MAESSLVTFESRVVRAMSGVSLRNIRAWVSAGHIEAPQGRGTGTRYSLACVVKAAAIQQLRQQGFTLSEAVDQIGAQDVEAMRRWVKLPAGLLPFLPELPTPADDAWAGDGAVGLWREVELLPGMVLRVREDARGFVKRTAGEIVRRYKA